MDKTTRVFCINQDTILECGPMPNVMAALPNIGGALCSTPQFGWRRLLQCRAVTLPRRKPLKFVGVPQTRQQISALSRPKFTILWDHLEEILLFNKFFADCRYMPHLRRHSPTKLCDGAQMAFLCVIVASCICSEPRAAHFKPAFQIRTKATPCAEVW